MYPFGKFNSQEYIKMKKVLSLLLTVLFCAGSLGLMAGCDNTTSDFERIQANGKMVVGVTLYEPMDYQDENGEWIGFDADLAKMMAQEWGVTAEFTIIRWNNKVAELNSRNIDVIWNGMTADEELGRQIDFSVSYAENMQVAVIQSSNASTIYDVDTVKAAQIAVERGSAGDTVATETLNAGSLNRVDSQLNALLEVEAGTSDVALIDYTMAYSVVGKGDFSNLMIVDTDAVSFEREVFAVGIRKGSDLTARINALFKEYYADGTLASLAEKYQGVALNDDALSAL